MPMSAHAAATKSTTASNKSASSMNSTITPDARPVCWAISISAPTSAASGRCVWKDGRSNRVTPTRRRFASMIDCRSRAAVDCGNTSSACDGKLEIVTQITMPITCSRAAVLQKHRHSPRLHFPTPKIGRNIVGAKCIVEWDARQRASRRLLGSRRGPNRVQERPFSDVPPIAPLSPTSWLGSPGRCWRKSAVMKRAWPPLSPAIEEYVAQRSTTVTCTCWLDVVCVPNSSSKVHGRLREKCRHE